MLKHGKRISKCIQEKLDEIEPNSKRPYNAVLTDLIVKMVMDEKTSNRDKITAIEFLVDRAEGKAVNTNINADITENPFDGINTEKLEALKKKLEEIKK